MSGVAQKADDPMIVRAMDKGQFVRVNESFKTKTGFDATKLAEKPFIDWIAPDDRTSVQAALKSGERSFFARHVTQDGNTLPLRIEVEKHGEDFFVLGRTEPAPTHPEFMTSKPVEATMSGTLDAIARIMEEQNTGFKCSILLVDRGRFVFGAGPSLPDEYNSAVNGYAIGPHVGSCGTAIFWNTPVIVEDIQADPLWTPLAGLAKKAGVAACWSHPFVSNSGNVLGALAFYSPEPCAPTNEQFSRLKAAARITGLAVERGRAEEELKLANAATKAARNQLQATLNALPDLLFEVDAEGFILDYHTHRYDLLAVPPEEFLGKRFADVLPQVVVDAVQRAIDGAAQHGFSYGETYPLASPDGEHWFELAAAPVDTSDKPGQRFVMISRDITERKQAEAKINYLAYFDQLTGLPNRTLLQDRLKQAMAASERSGCHGALLLLDLDFFKTLNDTLGHDMGDLLLKQVAQRLTGCVRDEDTVARLGGDEFVVMLVNLSESLNETATLIELIGGKITAAFEPPFDLKDVFYRMSASIGASVFSGHQADSDTLLKQADLAMYKSKEAGRNTLRFFDPDMAHDLLKRASLEHDLRDAVHEKQFVLHYQAQLAVNQVTGVEALLRWQHPEHGLIFPAEFIPALEDTGLILEVGQWVLETASQQIAAWAKQPEMSHLTVAVNISAHQLNRADFVDTVLMALERSGARPDRLKLELTESLLVKNVDEIIDKMTALKAKGVGFSLDDFGTGYSSLSYLKRLRLDQLKIDRSFVRDILADPNDAAIARMIVVLADSLGLAVVAEGVETEAQRASLAQQGCHVYQGHLFSRPVPLDEFESFLKRGP